MPILFTWHGRENPRGEETVQWMGYAQFDCGACSPVAITATHQISTSTSLEWCAIAPRSATIADVTWIDYSLHIVNSTGVGETLPRRTLVGATVHKCPPLP
jgi:hypothetical protein